MNESNKRNMAKNNKNTYVIRGKLSYPKIVGYDALALNYGKDAKEWSVDVQIDKATEKDFKSWGISNKIKSRDGYLDGAPYVRFKRAEFSKFTDEDGNPKRNKPIEIVNIAGRPWGEDLIGNETVADIKFDVVDYGQQTGMYIQKIRVLEHVPYKKGSDMPELSEDDKYFAEFAKEAKANDVADRAFRQDFNIASDDDLDDDLPM